MIRPFTLITMLLAAASGAYLFAVKHRAQVLDDQLAAVAQQSRLDGQRIRVLQAQWALEIDPSRVGQLAAQFTTLQPMKPAQLVTLASLRGSLPAAGSAAPGANPEDDAPAFLPASSNAGGVLAQASTSLPMPPELPPGPENTAQPTRLANNVAGAVEHVPHLASRSVLHMAASHYDATLPAPRPIRAISDTPIQTASAAAVATVPMGAQVLAAKAVLAPAVSNAVEGSALGMASDLAPPQPLGSEN